jgi:hypothetical protein
MALPIPNFDETYLASVSLTLAVELPLYGWLLVRAGHRLKRVLVLAALGTLCTHPVLWFVMPRFFEDYWTYVTVCEAAIIGIEAGVLRFGLPTSNFRVALSASAWANAASVFVGALVSWLF